jgi:Leucine-rich repeat (LRR) protein
MTSTERPAEISAQPPAAASGQRPLTAALGRATADLKGIATLLLTLASVLGAFVVLRNAVHLPSPWPELLCLVPVVIFLAFYLLPEWRAARERKALEDFGILGEPPPPGYFRLTPYGSDDRIGYRRPDGAEGQALRWVQRAKEVFLYLVGLSGVGKSSLLNAHVIPELKDAGWTVVAARPYDDPIGAIKTALRTPGVIWKQPPQGDTDLRALIERAAQSVARAGKRLLIVLDQFEEVLILLGEQERRPFAALLRDLGERPVANLTVLLSLRQDYIGDLEALPVPPPTYGANWFEVKRFTPAAARAFIARSDLKPGAQLIEQILREAAEIEDSLDQVRPVVINMYGLVLASFKGRLPADLVAGRLLTGYVRRSLDRAGLKPVSRAVIAPLVTDVGTKRARPLEEIAHQAAITPARARGALLHLAEDGLVRAVDKAGQRWEAAHDFVARLVLPLLEGARASRWDRLRPWLAPAAIIVWVALVALAALVYPEWEQARLRYRLAQAGLVAAPSPSAGTAFRFNGMTVGADHLAQALPLLLDVRPPVIQLELSAARDPIPLAALPRLPALATLDLRGTQLASPAGLPSFPALRTLDLRGTQLTSLAGLPGLPALTTLDLAGVGVISLAGMPALSALRTLDLRATRLTSLAGLPSLPALTTLNLSNGRLTALAGMADLAALTRLDLSGTRLTSLAGMPNLAALATLNLRATELTSLAGLPRLPALATLDLGGTPLTSLATLPGLPALETLDLSDTRLTSLVGMPSLAARATLDLRRVRLISLAGMPNLPALAALDLSDAELTFLTGMPSLPALTTLDVSGTQLASLADLPDLPALAALALSRTRLTSLRDLPERPALKELLMFGLKLERPFDLAALAHHAPTLERLVIGDTPVADYAGLARFTALTHVDLEGSKIRDVSVLTRLRALRSIDLQNMSDLDLRPLTALPRLQKILLSSHARPSLIIPAALATIVEWMGGWGRGRCAGGSRERGDVRAHRAEL